MGKLSLLADTNLLIYYESTLMNKIFIVTDLAEATSLIHISAVSQ